VTQRLQKYHRIFTGGVVQRHVSQKIKIKKGTKSLMIKLTQPRVMPYTYPSILGSDELRLLQPTSTAGRILRFRVRTVRRATKPSYAAVSYTWGNDEPNKLIYLDGQPFPVRPNLWSCLYYLSQYSQDMTLSYLWVDAICINQTNVVERNTQVRAMDRTYREASHVSVWLGLIPLPEEYIALLPQSQTIESDSFFWDDWMADLANRPYWSRFWVIQEFLLGPDVLLHCSNSTICWNDFKDILCRIAHVESYREEYDTSSTHGFLALPLVMGRHPDKHPEFFQPLDELLISHRRSECKDPRDRIFALLGLVTREEQQMLGRFFPDYTMTEEHVRIIALAHVTQYGPLVNRVHHREDTAIVSEELFLGLGVESRVQRKRLLRRAERIDYIGATPGPSIRYLLESHDMEEDMDLHLGQNDEPLEAQPVTNGRLRRTGYLFGLTVTMAIVWLLTWQRG
jgi:hypothetical protein